MPKITDTRKQKAAELLRMLERGPSFSDLAYQANPTQAAEAQVRIWCSTWIIPAVKKLVPKLKEKEKPL